MVRVIWVSVSLGAVLLSGCGSNEQAVSPHLESDSVTVGMPIEIAEALIQAHGVKRFYVADRPPEGRERVGLVLPENRLVEVLYDPEDANRITSMYLFTAEGKGGHFVGKIAIRNANE